MCFSYVQGIHNNFIDLVGGSELTRSDVLVAQPKVHNFYTTKTHWWDICMVEPTCMDPTNMFWLYKSCAKIIFLT
jgi:hypothetical protein